MSFVGFVEISFPHLIMSLSDMFLLFYISGGTREIIHKTKRWWFYFFILLIFDFIPQLFFSGKTIEQTNFLVFYFIHFVVLLIFSKQSTDAPIYYRTYLVILCVLAFDICLILTISISVTFFNYDYLALGTFSDKLIAHTFIVILKIAVAFSIKKVIQKQFFEFGTIFQTIIIMLPAFPYFILRNYAFFFHLESYNIPLIIRYLNVFFGISAMTNMIIGEKLSFQIRKNESIQIEKLARRRYDNYLINLNSMETVNRKYHDLRHIIRGIKSMNSIEEIKSSICSLEKEIQNFELFFNCGNQTLDVILSDQTREANEKNIQMHVHVDGQGWEIVSDIDLATIFGNAIENAIENSEKNEDLNTRYIDIRTGKVNEMLVARFENQLANEFEKNQSKFLSTKKDPENHGYGLQSIRMIVEKYSGEMDINTDNGTFTLTVIIPYN